MKNALHKKIFIVDDDPFWTALLTQILADLGYTDIISFTNGTDCINQLQQQPGLVFLDYQMGDINGLQVLETIKRYNADTMVIFCTNQQEVNIVVSAMKNGSCDYLVKSNSPENELALVVKKMLAPLVFSEKVF